MDQNSTLSFRKDLPINFNNYASFKFGIELFLRRVFYKIIINTVLSKKN